MAIQLDPDHITAYTDGERVRVEVSHEGRIFTAGTIPHDEYTTNGCQIEIKDKNGSLIGTVRSSDVDLVDVRIPTVEQARREYVVGDIDEAELEARLENAIIEHGDPDE